MKPDRILTALLLLCCGCLCCSAAQGGVRELINLNRGWTYLRGDHPGAEQVDYDDSEWEHIGLPHSFSIPYFLSSDFYTGYGWAGSQDGKAQHSAAYQGYGSPNASENFRIVNNVFYLSTGALIHTATREEWQPELEGNTYVQNEGGTLAVWMGDNGYAANYPYYYNDSRDTVTDVIRNVLGDETGTAWKN